MEWWILGILVALTIAVAIGMYVFRPSAKAAAERRRRYVLDDSGQRIPMAGEAAEAGAPTFEDPPGVFIQPPPLRPEPPASRARSAGSSTASTATCCSPRRPSPSAIRSSTTARPASPTP